MRRKYPAAVVICFTLLFTSCTKSDSPAGSGPGSATASGPEQDGRNFVMQELGKHWSNGPDGWSTVLNDGTDFAPIIFLRQMRSIDIDRLDIADLTDSDKLNGFEFAADVWLKRAPGREAGDSGIILSGTEGMTSRGHGQWTQWVDYTPMPLKIQKVKGQWQVHEDNSLVQGKPPTPADYAKAGVKE